MRGSAPTYEEQVVSEVVVPPPTVSALSRLWRNGALRRAILIAVGMRVGLGVLAWVDLLVRPDRKDAALGAWYDAHHLYGALLGPWQHFDALIYERLAAIGYQPHSTDPAFFPLYPGLIRLAVGPWSHDIWALPIAGLVLSTIAFALALWWLDGLVSRDLGGAVATRTILYLCLAPTSFYLVAIYPESLFLALVVGTFLAARRRRFLLAGLLATGASLARPQGIVLIVPLAVEAWQDRRARPGRWCGWRSEHLAAVALPIVGWVGFEIAVTVATGVSEFEAEARGWGVVGVPPWRALWDATRFAVSGAKSAGQLNVVAAMALLVGVAVAVRRLPWSYVAYTAASAVGLLTHEITAFPAGGPLKSTDRFVLAIFPLFAIAAVLTRGHRQVHRAIVVLSGILFLVEFDHFIHNDFVA